MSLLGESVFYKAATLLFEPEMNLVPAVETAGLIFRVPYVPTV
jgi:hypothetical protein